MGTSKIWTSENAVYSFSESTSLDPEKGRAHKHPSASLESVFAEIGSLDSPKRIEFASTDPTSGAMVERSLDTMPTSLLVSTMIFSLCNNSNVIVDDDGKFKPVGDPTEVAMIAAAQKVGFSREFFVEKLKMSRIGEFPFDSERKLMSAVYSQSDKPESEFPGFDAGKAFIFCKGAPERVLSNSTHYLSAKGSGTSLICSDASFAPMSPNFEEVVSQSASRMAESGLRVLALAYRMVSLDDAKSIMASKNPNESESQLVFVGLIGLIDPPKYAAIYFF